MWIVNFLLFIIFIIAAIGLFYFNQGATINNLSIGFREYEHLSLNFILLETFLAGAVWAFIFSIIQEIRLRLRISKINKATKKLQSEIERFRLSAVRDLDVTGEEEGDRV
ncbi:LapA family protein [bacterium]|nr:LapA family protein [bacterium]